MRAHAALGGRLVHGCQSSPNLSGGAIVPFGANLTRFTTDLTEFRAEWIAQIRALRAAQV